MSPPNRRRKLAPFAPLTILLPLALIATVLLPGGGVGAGTWVSPQAPTAGTDPVQVYHAGSGAPDAPSSDTYGVATITPPSPIVEVGGSVPITVSLATQPGYPAAVMMAESWTLSPSAPAELGSADQVSVTFYATSVSTATLVTVSVSVNAVIPQSFPIFFTAVASTSVTVVPPLTLTTTQASPDPASPGEAVTLSGQVEGGDPPYSIEVDFGDQTNAILNAPAPGPISVTHVYAAGIFQPRFLLSDSSGQSLQASVQSSVIVSAQLGAAILGPAGADEGVPVVLHASVGGGSAPYSYLWSDSWGDTSYSAGAWALTPGHVGPLTVRLTVSDSQGQTFVAPPTSFDVASPPSLTISSRTGEADVGTAFPFVLSVQGGNGPFEVDWSPGQGAVSQQTELPMDGAYSEPYTFSTPGQLWSSGEVQDALGVTFITSGQVGEVVPAPHVDVGAFPSVPTEGRPFTLTGSISGGLPPYSWDWVFGGPVASSTPLSGSLPTAGSVQWNGSLPIAEGLSADLQVSDASGAVVTGSLELEVLAPLQASLSLQPSRGEVDRGLTATVTVSGGAGPYTVSVSASDGEVQVLSMDEAGPLTFVLRPEAQGNLTVLAQVTDALGHQSAATARVPIALAFRAQLSLSSNAIDAGGHAQVLVWMSGGWAPFSGTLSLSDGRSFPFQGPSSDFSFNLSFPRPGPVILSFEVSDAVGATSGGSGGATVNPAPWASLQAGAAQTDVGSPLPFVVSAGGGTGIFPSVHVYFGDGGFATTWSTSHIYTQVGTFQANGSVEDSAGGMASSAPVSVHVVPAPQVAAEMTLPGADQGVGVPFASQVTFGTPPFSYLWDFGDGSVSAEAEPTHAYTMVGFYRVTLTVTDSAGSSVTAPPVNVSVAPSAALSASVNRTALEVGSPSLFQATVLGGAAPAQVTWTFGDGSMATGLVLNHTFSTPGTFTVVASLADAAGGHAVEDLVVTVVPALRATGVGAAPSTAEVGANLLLTEQPNGGVAPFQVSWQLGGLHAAGAGLTSWSLVPNASGTFQGAVTVTDAVGVASSVDFAIYVVPGLTVSPLLLPNAPEAGSAFQVTAGAVGGVPPFTYAWSLPPALPDPGNVSRWEGQVSSPGPLPVGVTVTDVLGRTVSASVTLNVAPALLVYFGPGGLNADVGVPLTVDAVVQGGVGNVTTTLTTPFGSVRLGSAPVVFPTPGVFPVSVEAVDQDGAVSVSGTNVTVHAVPVAAFLSLQPTVAVGASQLWKVRVVGGSAPYLETWDVAGVGSWSGGEVNVTLAGAGTYGVTLTVQDSAGARSVLRSNVTAVNDPLSLSMNASAVEGLLPLQSVVTVTPVGGEGPIDLSVTLDGNPCASPVETEPGLPWSVSLDLMGAGAHVVLFAATDALGATATRSLTLRAYAPLLAPVFAPDPAQTGAGVPLRLTGSSLPDPNGTGPSQGNGALDWWGPDIALRTGAASTFLSDSSGTSVVDLSDTLVATDGRLLQNLTVPVPVAVLPGPAEQMAFPGSRVTLPAGVNLSVEVEALDRWGNPNTSYAGPLSAGLLTGPEGAPLSLESGFVDGRAPLNFYGTHAGTATYALTGGPGPRTNLSVIWEANPLRAVLRLLSWERSGSSLLLNISALDAFGNPLSNVSVTAEVPGGPSVQGVAENGSLSLILPGATGVSQLELLGPAGAQTTVLLPGGNNPSSSSTDLLLVATLLGGVLATGLVLSWQRRRSRRSKGTRMSTKEAPGLMEAKGAMEEIIAQLPGEDRASLLVLAEEHGIARQDAEEALVLLERDHRAVRTNDSEGVERWDPPVPREEEPMRPFDAQPEIPPAEGEGSGRERGEAGQEVVP